MQDSTIKFFTALGIITAIYLLLRFVLPFILKAFFWIAEAFLYIIIIVLIILAVIWILGFILKTVKKDHM